MLEEQCYLRDRDLQRDVSEKKVHGGMKLRIHEDEDKDEQVSSQHINDEEKNKQKDLSLCIL